MQNVQKPPRLLWKFKHIKTKEGVNLVPSAKSLGEDRRYNVKLGKRNKVNKLEYIQAPVYQTAVNGIIQRDFSLIKLIEKSFLPYQPVTLVQWNLDLTNLYHNEVLDITNDILCPGQSYSKMYEIEPRYNEFFDIRGGRKGGPKTAKLHRNTPKNRKPQ